MGFRSMMDEDGPRKKSRLLLAALAFAALTHASPVYAQSPEDLRAARELFQEAFKDEQEGRLPEALDKFQRVAKVKESPSVRYRIATVLGAMGRLREARDIFRALAASRASLSPSDRETADSAAEKAAELNRRIPKLSLRVQDRPPPDVRVTVDGAPVPVSTTPQIIELDPGGHVVAGAARGAVTPEKTVTLEDGGGEVAHTVVFTSDAAPPPPSAKSNTLAIAAVAGGGALVVLGTIFLVLREGAIDDIQAACPLNTCPSTLRGQVDSDRDRAEVFGPLGIGLGVVGLAAIGVGVYMLVRPASAAQASTLPYVATRRGLALTF